ncbi:peptide chain release factor 1 [Thiospirochaeta perfilievii]|uniref:Peptide chain release factor 1 n=1 Tax=Thiospirochaeta perfilievii TaxID=252967 RepID=A0A5C1Q996_9SPIO|nr:peptide chain release factor 1 [Thiospirochaeta perfilievii]QEN03948.1 peptide chain release factor 1 [Thiospirochaeta perfilievii]
MKLDVKLDDMVKRFNEVEKQIADPDVLSDQKKYKDLMVEYSHLSEVVTTYNRYNELTQNILEAKEMLEMEEDAEMKEMAREELKELESQVDPILQELQMLLVPKDPLDGKDIIMEIRAGTGGDEAALFATDLYRMYVRYAEQKNWKVEIISSNENELGGFKEVVFSISGKNVYANLRYESGGHRVQRVPVTESNGRIQTSAATVAVLPEAEEADVDIKQNDLKIDVFRSQGCGGQSVNTTDSAVRITHLPTGVVVTCQDEKSQLKNKNKAMKVLRSRILEAEIERVNSERSENRKEQVGSGDRSQRIRTYNFPQGRVTDHRINLTLYKLDSFMQGNMEEMFSALKLSAQEDALK